jgi:hypothetical protein
MRYAVGVVVIAVGSYSLILNKVTARGGATFHRRWATVAPWLYPKGLDRLATSERAWRPVSVGIGLICIVAGAMTIAGAH